VQRDQITWVIFGLLVALGVFLAVGMVHAIIPWFTTTPERAVALLGFTSLTIFAMRR